MGLGGTAKKLQKMIDTAEQTYHRLNEMREQMNALRETVEATGDRVERLEAEQRDQRALLEALADEQGVDVDAVLTAANADATAATSDVSDSAVDEPAQTDNNS